MCAAFRGRRPPTSKPIPSSCLGDSDTSDSYTPRIISGRHVPCTSYDQEQQEKGSKGQGSSGQEIKIEVQKGVKAKRSGPVYHQAKARRSKIWAMGAYINLYCI